MKRNEQAAAIKFNNIIINSIDTASGVFFGTNAAHGWSSHNKSNYGFGSLHEAVSSRNVQIIYDNDYVDMPVNETQHYWVNNRRDLPSHTRIDFQEMNVNALDTNASISVGEVGQSGWSSHQKSNFGGGRHKGIVISQHDVTNIIDKDTIDSPINDSMMGIRRPEGARAASKAGEQADPQADEQSTAKVDEKDDTQPNMGEQADEKAENQS